ncbi:Calcium/calmodulin-dependent protein kinase type II alpha chain [Gryllus bimaculatus]|nr:Calcium/calmodulin-dependent protein kinase type II alpha chain [Gryllus bimaculatus]
MQIYIMEFKSEPFEEFYDVYEEIGKGQFAVVRRCVEKSTGNQFAAKFMRKRRVCRGVSSEDIEREVKLLLQLKHKNIVSLHQVFESRQEVVLVLELIEGGELFHYVSKRDRLDENEAAHFIRQILEALEHMHNNNVAHLDLKPENILLLNHESLHIKLIDFGLSQQLAPDTRLRAMFGTPEFVAPEIVNYEPLSLGTDMWALGVITYILVSGASPFLGDDKQETFSNVVAGIYSFDDEYFSNVSELAKNFISQLLVKEPSERATVSDCLQHIWLQTYSAAPVVDNVKIIEESEEIKEEKKDASELMNEMNKVVLKENEKNTIRENKIKRNRKHNVQILKKWHHCLQAIRICLRLQSAAVCFPGSKEDNFVVLALHCAAVEGNSEGLDELLGLADINVNVTNKHGVTAAHIAAGQGHDMVLTLLQARGANLYAIDDHGDTPLMWAARHGQAETMKMLVNIGVTISCQNKEGDSPLHYASSRGHLDCLRVLVDAGASLDLANNCGATALHQALAKRQSHCAMFLLHSGADIDLQDVSSQREDFIKQLIPTSQPLGRINVKFFGHSGVGKSTLIESLKAGYFLSFFRKSKSTPGNNTHSGSTSPGSKTQIEMDVTSSRTSLSFDTYNYQYTRGINVQQVNLSGPGDVSLWEFSGQDTYFLVYDRFLGNTNCLHVVVFNLEDPPSAQLQQCCFWLSFLQARIPPAEPLGDRGVANRVARVLLVATHADSTRTPRTASGAYVSSQAERVLEQVRERFGTLFDIHDHVTVVDSHVPAGPGIKAIKNYLAEGKRQVLQEVPRTTAFLEGVVSWLHALRRNSPNFPVLPWPSFVELVHCNVNPLAGEEHLRELLQQLQLMGECENDDELEFEFPCYNFVETLDGLWDESDPRYCGPDSCYGGVKLRSPPETFHLIHSIFPRIQVQLRRTVQSLSDPDSDLYQWFEGSKLCSGPIESLITLEEDGEAVEMKVRGPVGSELACFYFMEELLGIVDQVLLEMSPGLPIEKHVLSAEQLREHSEEVHCWSPADLMEAVLRPQRLDSTLLNPVTEHKETLLDLVGFGAPEVRDLVLTGDELPVSALSTVCRQQLCRLLDPPDPLGKDWCLLAVKLGLDDKIATLDLENNLSMSRTARLLDEWAKDRTTGIGLLIKGLQDLGREDACQILLRSAPLYRIVPSTVPQNSPVDGSHNSCSNLSR